MITIETPSNLSPFDRPAIFRFAGDTADDAGTTIDALLEDADSGELLAARQIHLDERAAAQFDVAPILRRAMMLQPAGGPTGLFGADDSQFRVRMSAGGVQSAAVTLICTAPQQTAATALLTALPAKRTLHRGQTDRLLFYAPTTFTAATAVHAADGSVRLIRYAWEGDAGLVAMRLRADDFGMTARRIVVSVDGTIVAEYEVADAADGSMRLAWRTGKGILEHYTFPVVVRRTLVAQNRSVRLADGTCTLAAEAYTDVQLASQCEDAATVRTLARIAASPQVWAVDGESEGYVQVEVVTREVVTHSFGEPSNVELTVRPSQYGVEL